MFESINWKTWLKRSLRNLATGKGPKNRRSSPSSKPQVQSLEDRITPAEVGSSLIATITPTSFAATEQTQLSLKNKGLSVADVNGDAGTVTVSLAVTEGILTVLAGDSGATVTGSGAASVTIAGTAAQINDLFNTNGASDVIYVDNSDAPSASATLTLQISDDGPTPPPPSQDTAIINITPENDAPTVTAPASFAGAANTPILVNGITFADVDGTAGNELAFFAAVNGAFTAADGGGVTVTGSGANNVTLLGSPADLTAFITNGQLTFTTDAAQDITVSIDDLGNSGTKGQKTASVTIAVTLSNTAPSITGDKTGHVTEAGGINSGTATATGDLNAADVDNPNDLWTVVPAGAASLGGFGTYGVAADGKWTYTLDNANAAVQALNGAATLTDTFNAATADGTNQVVTITIEAQNDAPVNTVPGGQTATPGTNLVFNSANNNAITIADADGAVVNVALAVLHGTLTLGSTDGLASQTGNGTGTVNLSGSVAAVNDALHNLAYLVDAGFAGVDTLTVTTVDSDTLQDQDQIAIAPRPVVTAGAADLLADQSSLVIAGSGFDAQTPQNNVVIFSGGLTGVVLAATETQLTVGNFGGSGLVGGPLSASVSVNGASSGAPVEVAKVVPVITASTSPLAGNATTILIHGFGFDPTPGNNTITFSGAATGTGTITAANANALTVSLPTPLGEGPLMAVVTANTSSSGAPVQVANLEAVDLAVTNVDSPDTVHPGENITYTISLKNNAAATAAQKIHFFGAVPAGTTFVSFTAPTEWTSATPSVGGTGPITSTFNSLAAGATADFTLIVKVNADFTGGPIENTVSATTDNFDGNSSNDSQLASTVVAAQSDLQVAMTGPANASPNSDVAYVVTITNAGPSDAQTVTLNNVIPAGATFVSASQNAGPTFTLTAPTAGSSTGAVSASIATLAAGASATFTLVFHAGAAATVTNEAIVATATADAASANNSAKQITAVSPDITIPGTTGNDTLIISSTSGNALSYSLNGAAPVTLTGITSFTFNGLDGDDAITINLPATGGILSGNIAVDGGAGANTLVFDANGQPTQVVIGSIKGTQQKVTFVNVQTTNVHNALSAYALAGPNTADRDTAFVGLNDKQRFVQALYLDVLGRAGVTAELDFWVGVLNTSGQGAVASGIGRSNEACNHLVQTWYKTYLGRSGDASETQGFANLLKNGQTEEVVLGSILGGSEFQNRATTLVTSGTDKERYVTALYQLLLARVPDASEVAGWVSSGLANDAIARSFLQSKEFRTNQIEAYYMVLLHRPAETEGRAFWTDSGSDLAKVRAGFGASPEFFAVG